MKVNYEYNDYYLNRIENVLDNHLTKYPRTLCIRIDLRYPITPCNVQNDYSYDFPTVFINSDNDVMKRFFDSLKAQVKHEECKKIKNGKRVHNSGMSYVWVREFGESNNEHFHVLLLFNKDRYYNLGSFGSEDNNLANKIRKAWSRALNVEVMDYPNLVHFPEHPCYHLNTNADSFLHNYQSVINRARYLAKKHTKSIGRGQRNFGASLAK
ncbi:inovirus Gp2 family protein [Photobacterium sp. DNB23_23_1]